MTGVKNSEIMYLENAQKLLLRIKETDYVSSELKSVFCEISNKHKANGGYLEYAYLEHFLEESLDISLLFQHLFTNEGTRRFLAIPNRMMFETILKVEYLIRVKNEGDDNVILSLLSKDMAAMMSSLDEAVGNSENNQAKSTLIKMNIANKILKTDFDLDKIKPNTKTFPNIKDLCERSHICIKDYCGERLWHYYVMWSWDNHSRIGSKFMMKDNSDYLTNNQAECFIEMYLKNLRLLSIHSGSTKLQESIQSTMLEIGLKLA